MIILGTPQRRDDFVIVGKVGETLTVNGDVLDFAALLPSDGAIPDYESDEPRQAHEFVREAKRVGGELTVTLILPHGPNPDEDEAFPALSDNAPDGIVIDQPAVAAAKVEAIIAGLVAIGAADDEALRAAVSAGRERLIADGWSECRADRQLLGVIREWQATGELAAYSAPPPPSPPPAETGTPSDYPLTARQLRLGLVRNGVTLDKVQATIDALPSPQRDEAEIYWKFSTEIHWDHPMTQSLMALAGIPDEAAAAMWMLAKDYEK